HRAIDFGGEPLIKVRFWNSDPDAFDVARERLERTSVDYLKQDCDVFNRSGHRSGVIERPRERDYTAYAHAAICWFQPDNAAQRCGNANRSAGVCSKRTEAEAESDRTRRPATRSATDSIRIPRIPRRAVMRIDARHTIRKLMQVRFSNDDRARLFQSADCHRVLIRDPISEYLRPRRRSYALRVVQILHRKRHAL